MQDLKKRLGEKQLALSLTQKAVDAIVEKGYDPVYGARPLKRYIQHALETAIAKRILAGDFSAGQTVTGVVRSVEDYGIFVEITPNLAGLAEPRENVRVGQQASVYIKSILRDKMKIKLIIIDSFESSYSPEIKYFIPSDKVTEWDYSPDNCYKRISTNLCG